eukprot:4634870-Lingulodinium_polyedra.AAC.1
MAAPAVSETAICGMVAQSSSVPSVSVVRACGAWATMMSAVKRGASILTAKYRGEATRTER